MVVRSPRREYDRYGNMSCVQNANTNGYCPQWAYSASTNHITTTGCTYDAAGNMTKDCSSLDNHSYQWGAEGRVSKVDLLNSPPTWTFTYNAVGDRVQWASPSETDQHLFDPAGRWLTNAGQFSVVWWGNGALAVYAGSETYLEHRNNLGSTTMKTDYSGAAARDMLFYPWGQVWESWGADGYNFAGLPWRDLTTTTDLTTFRNFSPGLGRWLSPDPVAGDTTNPQSLNRYAYVTNNPTSTIDPSGLDIPQGEIAADWLRACTSNPSCLETEADYGWQRGWYMGSAGLGGGPWDDLDTDPSDQCAYAGSYDASCGQAPGLWPGGDPIHAAPPPTWGGIGFGGGSGPLSGDFGPLGYPSPSIGTPCDFGTCGWPTGLGFSPQEGVLTLPVVFQVTSWAWPLAVTGVLIGADAALLANDLYQGYRLAQAYGHFLPTVHQARKPDIKQFDQAVRAIERRCGRPLSQDEQRQLHNAIHGQGLDFNGIVQWGVDMFCPGR